MQAKMEDILHGSQADSADSLMTDLKVQKAFDFVKENAEITEVVDTDGQ